MTLVLLSRPTVDLLLVGADRRLVVPLMSPGQQVAWHVDDQAEKIVRVGPPDGGAVVAVLGNIATVTQERERVKGDASKLLAEWAGNLSLTAYTPSAAAALLQRDLATMIAPPTAARVVVAGWEGTKAEWIEFNLIWPFDGSFKVQDEEQHLLQTNAPIKVWYKRVWDLPPRPLSSTVTTHGDVTAYIRSVAAEYNESYTDGSPPLLDPTADATVLSVRPTADEPRSVQIETGS